jgi:hypothetical protein
METAVDADALGVPVSMYAMNESKVLTVFFSKGKSGEISFVAIFDIRAVDEAREQGSNWGFRYDLNSAASR